MTSYCTLFDSVYLSRGLAMYDSLLTHSSDFQLYIFAFDSLTERMLKKLNLERVTVISLEEFETEELRKVKKERSKAEYCWTCTSSTISHILKNFDVSDCTYVDSDLFFFSDPSVLISELDEYKKNVLMTEHRFSFLPRLYEEKRAGRFCVQFLTFRNEESSLVVLEKWRKQCIEWCYARYEDGKFGDQKYLDEWPLIYNNTHTLKHEGGGVAPWNLDNYRFYNEHGTIKGIVRKTGSEFNLVFYHFQYVKFLENKFFDIGWYHISSFIKKLLYRQYLIKIEQIETMLVTVDTEYHKAVTIFRTDGIRNKLKTGFKKTFGYNIISI
jgi:hypothetical protein